MTKTCKSVVMMLVAMLMALLLISPVIASIVVKNNSFEVDSPTKWPYYCAITDWTDGSGVNTSSGPFADNGIIPDGQKVAFIQGIKSMSQSIDGFEAGKYYLLTYCENARSNGVPVCNTTIGSQTIVASHSVVPTKSNYYTRNGIFIPAESGSYTLSFNQTGSGDVTVLIDNVQIKEISGVGNISGKVVDFATANPISGATVNLDGLNTVTTDATGAYSFDIVAPGVSHKITVSADGYSNRIVNADMPDPAVQMNIDLPLFSLDNVSATVIDTFDNRGPGTDLGTTESAGTLQLPWVKSTDDANIALTGDAMELIGAGSAIGAYLGGDFAPADFELTTELTWVLASTDAKWAGIAYRQPSLDYTGGGYYVSMGNDGKTMTLKRGSTTLKSASLDAYADNYTPHMFKIRVLGERHQVWIDDTPIIDVYDGGNITGGNVGFICDGSNDVLIGSVNLNVYNTPSWTMTGKVIDSATSAPLPGATVTVFGRTGTTDSNGVYSIAVPASQANIYQGGSCDITWSASVRRYKNLSYTAHKDISGLTVTQDLAMVAKVPVTIAEAKTKDNGTQVYISDAVVTGKYNGCVYVEDKNRVAGIKMISTSVALNDDLDIEATVVKANGETYLDAPITTEYGVYVVAPLGTSERAFAGTGLSANGLLMKTWGKVTSIDPNGAFMYINDGSNDAGVKIAFTDTYDLTLPTAAIVGENVSVSGIATYDTDGKTLIIHPRSAMDVVNAAYAQVVVHESDFGAHGDGFNWARSSYVNPDDWTDHTSFTDQGIYCEQTTNQWYNRIRCWLGAGTPLTDITCLKYAAFVDNEPAGMTNATFELQMCVDMNGDGAIDDVLHYEPYKNNGLAFAGIPGTWQVWDALNGQWYCESASDSSIATSLMPRTDPKSLAYYLSNGVAAGATATLITDDNWRGVFSFNTCVNDAPSVWDGFKGTLGCFIMETTSGGTIYSFAP